jgi:release factor glutamine methyltransferase
MEPVETKATVGEMLRHARSELKRKGIGDWRLDAEWLMSHVMGKERMELLLHPNMEMKKEEQELFFRLLQRRIQGEPLQYILGTQEFMGLRFKVDRRVLIPRQDTETLVEEALRVMKRDWRGTGRILEIGTGSGAIAVSLAKLLPQSFVTAVDLSPGALSVAAANARSHGVDGRIAFLNCDFLRDSLSDDGERYHLLVSNPPYIPSGEIQGLQREVKDYEPRMALDGGEDGLLFYRVIKERAPSLLHKGGMLLLEVGYNQAEKVRDILSDTFHHIETIKDLAGIDRGVGGRF